MLNLIFPRVDCRRTTEDALIESHKTGNLINTVALVALSLVRAIFAILELILLPFEWSAHKSSTDPQKSADFRSFSYRQCYCIYMNAQALRAIFGIGLPNGLPDIP